MSKIKKNMLRHTPRSEIAIRCIIAMQTLYLFIITLVGGFLALFSVAGWSSYKDKKLPTLPIMFRWFVSGILSTGLLSYAWIFGAGGDPSALLGQVGEALDVHEVMGTLTSAVGSTKTVEDFVKNTSASESEGITIGMPTF